jgi:ketosteroid isomerase-like protein
MALQDIELIRQLYEALNNRDIDGVVELVHEDMVAHVGPGMPWSGSYYGPVGFRNFIHEFLDYVELRVETDSLVEAGPLIAQVGRVVGRAHATGIPFSFDEIHLWGVRDGKVSVFRNYSDFDEQRRVLAADLELTPDR